jgi:hypothetical protein
MPQRLRDIDARLAPLPWERLWERPALRSVTQSFGRGMGEILGEIPPHRLVRCGTGSQPVAPFNPVSDWLLGESPDGVRRFGNDRRSAHLFCESAPHWGVAGGHVPGPAPSLFAGLAPRQLS